VLEPHPAGVFRRAVHWPGAASLSNPQAVTKAYAAHLARLGGVLPSGNAGSLHRADGRWRIETAEGPIDASEVVMALGPFAPDVLRPLGIRLPLGSKRGYHLHFRTNQNAGLTRPVVDVENGYCPMEQAIRFTTGAEFAARTAAQSRFSSIACCRMRAACCPSPRRSKQRHGWDAGRALRIQGQ